MARFIPRLYLDSAVTVKTEITLSKEQAHYLANVMRKKAGDKILIFNAKGEWLVQITANKSCLVLEQTRQADLHKPLALYFSPVKQHTEFIIQKATELGVTDIHPVIFDHSMVRKINPEKLYKIMVEAAEQCERLSIPRLHDLVNFTDLKADKIIVCSEKRNNPFISQVLNPADAAYAVMIGPEGGFSEKEFEQMLADEYVFATLSANVLRSDTAVVVALGCCQGVLAGD